VLAVTFLPSDSIAMQIALPQFQSENDFVSLGRGAAEEKRRKCFGVSTETNQCLVISLYLVMLATDHLSTQRETDQT
jgi:hypothetical protein